MKLKVKDISKNYNRYSALRGVNLELEPGLYGLLGPNGAGKSTILKTVAKQLQEMGETAAYDQIMLAVSDFEKGNLRLSTVLASMQTPNA